MYQYVLVCTGMYIKINEIAAYLRVEGRKVLLWYIKRITSCTQHTPEHVRLPFHTAKCSLGTIHYMGIKNMVQLCRSPVSARICPLISFIRKTQLLLQILTYPLSQLATNSRPDVLSFRCTQAILDWIPVNLA